VIDERLVRLSLSFGPRRRRDAREAVFVVVARIRSDGCRPLAQMPLLSPTTRANQSIVAIIVIAF